MVNETRISGIIAELCSKIAEVFPNDSIEAIIFGSYARGDASVDSDLDVLLLVDASREAIARRNWQVGNIAAELLLDYGILVSPVVENREYFKMNAEALPFYRNINQEGVRFELKTKNCGGSSGR